MDALPSIRFCRLHLALFALFVVVGDLLLIRHFKAALERRGLLSRDAALVLGSTAFLGWPLYFSLQRGNIESLLWIGMAIGTVLFARGRFSTAAVVWGAVGSVKLYPLVLLALFIHRRMFRFLLLGLVAAAVTTVAGLRFLGPDIVYTYKQISHGVERWTEITTLSYPQGGIGTDHSLLGLLRQCTRGAIIRPSHALPV